MSDVQQERSELDEWFDGTPEEAAAKAAQAAASQPDGSESALTVEGLTTALSAALAHLSLAYESTIPAAPFEATFAPFATANGRSDEVKITVRAHTAEELAQRVYVALTAVQPVMDKAGYAFKPRMSEADAPLIRLDMPALPNVTPLPAQQEQEADGRRGRRREGREEPFDDSGRGRRSNGNGGGAPQEGSFEIKTIQVFMSKRHNRPMLAVEGWNGEKIVDGLEAGPSAWAKYFPADEREDWRADMENGGTIWDVSAGDAAMVCYWRRKGEYQNISRIEYKG